MLGDAGGECYVPARLTEGMVYRLTADTAEYRKRLRAVQQQYQGLQQGPGGNLRL